jgi:hypothetical protein
MAGSIADFQKPVMLVSPQSHVGEVGAELEAMDFRPWLED